MFILFPYFSSGFGIVGLIGLGVTLLGGIDLFRALDPRAKQRAWMLVGIGSLLLVGSFIVFVLWVAEGLSSQGMRFLSEPLPLGF